MSYEIKLAKNQYKNNEFNASSDLFDQKNALKIHTLHTSMGDLYNVTPLVRLKELAKLLGVKEVFVKDESQRGNLKAFKLLGGAYSVAAAMAKRLGKDVSEIDFEYLKSAEVKELVGEITFAAASDGNHGKSVAWAADQFNQKSIVYMPKGTVQDRIDAITVLGGEVIVTDMNYDGCVSTVNKLGKEKGWEVILDTAAEGDPEVAAWVMQGYATMAYESYNQLKTLGIMPTHVFTQAGVGSMAASAIGIWANHTAPNFPKFYTLEPHQADCYYRSGLDKDGNAVSVDGDMDSISAGLACGVPNPISWDVIRNFADGFLSSDDHLTANGMRILGNPLPGDCAITSGDSGAIGAGVIVEMLTNQQALAKEIGINKDSVILLYSTEGETDRVNYRNVVWYGSLSTK